LKLSFFYLELAKSEESEYNALNDLETLQNKNQLLFKEKDNVFLTLLKKFKINIHY